MFNLKDFFQRNIRIIPKKKSVISDLFIWRQNQYWETKFELVNFKSLFDENNYEDEIIKLEIRDKDGKILFVHTFEVKRMKKKTINFTKILKNLKLNQDYGTFSIYHEHTDIINEFNSFVAERGYSSYKFKNFQTFSSVHGNLDAISFLNNQSQLLGKQTLFNKIFNIQFIFDNDNFYDLFFINPTNKILRIELQITKTNQEFIRELNIMPAGSEFINLKKDHNVLGIKVKSKYYMSRPLVFEYNENFLNSFHA